MLQDSGRMRVHKSVLYRRALLYSNCRPYAHCDLSYLVIPAKNYLHYCDMHQNPSLQILIQCFQNHCITLALNACPLAGSHHLKDSSLSEQASKGEDSGFPLSTTLLARKAWLGRSARMLAAQVQLTFFDSALGSELQSLITVFGCE